MKKCIILCFGLFLSLAVSAQSNYALKFDGSDDYVLVGRKNELLTSNFTVEAWVKVEGGSGTTRTVFSKRYWDGFTIFGGWTVTVSGSDRWTVGLGVENGWSAGITGDPVIADVWTHIALVRNGTNFKLYINGSQAGEITENNYHSGDGGLVDFTIGVGTYNLNNRNYYFNGSIDEVRYWNVARTQQEI